MNPARPRRLFRIGCVTLPLLLLALFVYALRRDSPPPDDADLRSPPPFAVPEDENAFFYFQKAAEKLVPPPEGWGSRNILYSLGEDLATDLIHANQEMLSFLERGIVCAACQAPDGADMGLPFEPMADILLLRSHWYSSHDSMIRAFEDAVRGLGFSILLRDLDAVDGRARAIEESFASALEELYVDSRTDMAAMRQGLSMLKACRALRAVNERQAVREMCRWYGRVEESLEKFARQRGAVDDWWPRPYFAAAFTGLGIAERTTGT